MKTIGAVGLALLSIGSPSACFAEVPKILYYGFSQSGQGFCGIGGEKIETILLENECPDPAEIEGVEIIGIAKGSAAVELWKDPEYQGYDFDAYHLPKPSAIRIEKDEANVVVLNISGGQRPLDAWVSDIQQAVATMKSLHPIAQRIYLQPVGTGPLDEVGDPIACRKDGTVVRAVRNHPDILSAINQVAEQDQMVYTGLIARLSSCEFFDDSIGHYSADGGAAEVRQQIEDFYARLVTEPPELVPPMPPTNLQAID